MDVVVESSGLQECLGSMLASFERSVGFAEGVVMSFDPDVLLPSAFAATVEKSLDDALVIRSVISAVHTGEFLGIAATGRKIRYDAVDMYRVADGRIVWRFLLCDWKGVLNQLTAAG